MIPDLADPIAIDRLLGFLLPRIECLLFGLRPMMLGGDAAGIEMMINNYIEIWAIIMNRRGEFHTARAEVRVEEGNPSHWCRGFWKIQHPDASEQELTGYVVEQWRKIADRVGVPVSLETYQKRDAEGRAERGW